LLKVCRERRVYEDPSLTRFEVAIFGLIASK
jgi:hypothetical protein